ncbi:DUF2867 domain-containing protein [Pararhizobium sp. BT-229]|uniref:DUF2867 domain-containing protein n=1 Tax=Pararhizobium sp. BT-229 TaxID=2986923 RepID=UPI0021F7724B|nr:DUF2867 domain-containing protein [Pararhizobium sp. BT-229]MCV9966063.1 DUF2867 domain-containing protein [Pararhizobium sp. BT-229]
MPPRPHAVPVTLPHPALPLADWADCYELLVPGQSTTAISAAKRALADFPAWVRTLMWLRNAIVSPFGLKGSGARPDSKAEMIGFFPVISRSSEQAILGFDDIHVDFRIVVDVRQAGELAQRVSVTTLVRRKILLGKIYIAVITPFHRLIVKTMLSRLARPVAAV